MSAPATLDHLGDVEALEAAVMGAEAWGPGPVGDELVAPNRVVRVATEESSVVGWIDLSVTSETADLLRIAVHPGSRRRGVAGRLLADAVDRLPASVERVLLEVAADNDAALGLYAHHGFTEIDRRAGYYRDGTDALVMQLVLASTSTAGGAR